MDLTPVGGFGYAALSAIAIHIIERARILHSTGSINRRICPETIITHENKGPGCALFFGDLSKACSWGDRIGSRKSDMVAIFCSIAKMSQDPKLISLASSLNSLDIIDCPASEIINPTRTTEPPPQYFTIMENIRDLGFEDCPDYAALSNLFYQVFKQSNDVPKSRYERKLFYSVKQIKWFRTVET